MMEVLASADSCGPKIQFAQEIVTSCLKITRSVKNAVTWT